MTQTRINKFLSLCGVTSRRGAEVMISEERVTVNDKTVSELGTLIDPDKDCVKVDGVVASPARRKVYVLLNKPKMTMTTLHDPFKRKTILHYLKKVEHRIYPVGRLDYDAEGLLILTNDGDLAFRLAHPSFQVAKIYEVQVEGRFEREAAQKIEAGITLDDGATGRADVSVLGFVGSFTRVRLTLTEGRKREVKQLCKKVGHPVKSLRRVEFAGLQLKNLKPGQWRYLTSVEISRLQQLVGIEVA